MQFWTALYLNHRTSRLCHKLSSDSWQILDQEMTGVLDHHRQCCALTQAYKEASRWTSVQPSTELVIYALCMRVANSSPCICLNTVQKCSGGRERDYFCVVLAGDPCGAEGDMTDTCHAVAWLPPLPVRSIPPGSPRAAGREALGGTGWRGEHRAPVGEPLWDGSSLSQHPVCDTLWDSDGNSRCALGR